MDRTIDRKSSTGISSAARARRAVLGLLAAVSLVSMSGADAQEADPPADPPPAPAPFAVQPSGPDGPGGRDYFIYGLAPGETFGDTVAVSNLSERPIDFVIFPTDAFNVPDEGGFTAARDGEEPVDAGTWITLGTDSYTVAPGKRVEIPFQITVPDDAEPGDHAAAILAADADRRSVSTDNPDSAVQVRARVGARVYVRVDGPVAPGLRIDYLDVEHESPSFAVPVVSNDGTATISWGVTNTGNVRLAPSATIKIKGLFGRTIKTLPTEQLPELLPGSNVVRISSVDGLPPLEKITVELTLTADQLEVVGTTSYWVVPWLFVGGLALLVLGLALWRRRRRRRLAAGTPPPSAARPREQVPA